jgi:hypothetical protein
MSCVASVPLRSVRGAPLARVDSVFWLPSDFFAIPSVSRTLGRPHFCTRATAQFVQLRTL